MTCECGCAAEIPPGARSDRRFASGACRARHSERRFKSAKLIDGIIERGSTMWLGTLTAAGDMLRMYPADRRLVGEHVVTAALATRTTANSGICCGWHAAAALSPLGARELPDPADRANAQLLKDPCDRYRREFTVAGLRARMMAGRARLAASERALRRAEVARCEVESLVAAMESRIRTALSETGVEATCV